jgi:hypothetical protein
MYSGFSFRFACRQGVEIIRTKERPSMNAPNWPFPPPSGPIPWTAKQKADYERAKRDKQGDAPW